LVCLGLSTIAEITLLGAGFVKDHDQPALFQFVPVFFMCASGMFLMGSNRDMVLFLINSHIDVATYALILLSFCFVIMFYFYVLVDLYFALAVARHVEDAEHRAMPHRLYTLIFPMDNDRSRVLLGMKKRGFGCNKYNGFGGKVEAEETIDEGAIRELNEESGLLATRVDKQGLLLFYFEDNPVAMEVHVYLASEYTGDVVETDEMRPEWFGIHELPFAQMWADDERWWPHVLRGEKFVGRFWFKADQITITREELSRVESLSF
ncbi:hypothetical protein IW136_005066, partial [Coemansia sp. RSA 678]